MGAVHYVYLAVAGGRVAYVGVGKRRGYYDRVYMHLRGHSSAARRGLRADVFIILAYTYKRRLAEMWESWLYEVFKPPFNKRRPSAEPRRPPLFPRARRRDKPVEEPAAATRCVKLMDAPPVASTRLAKASVSDATPETYADRPPPG